MASRLLTVTRRSVSRKLLRSWEELGGVPLNPVHSVRSSPHFYHNRSSWNLHPFCNFLRPSPPAFSFHRRDTENEVVVAKREQELTTFKLFTDAQFDPLRKHLFSSDSHASFRAVHSAASQVAPQPESEDDEDEAQKTRKVDVSADEYHPADDGHSAPPKPERDASPKVEGDQKVVSKKKESMSTKVRRTLAGVGPSIRAVAGMDRDDWAETITGWRKHFREQLQHYWLGSKLLWADIRIASKLIWKASFGKGLSQRERQHLSTTAVDIVRLVPFAAFVIVPFMELLLPFVLRIFPSILPSAFQDERKEKRLQARTHFPQFLQDTVKEMERELEHPRTEDLQKKARRLHQFISKLRTGADVTNDELLEFANLFSDELIVDNISRPRLLNMCKHMGIHPCQTDAELRQILRTKLNQLKLDDGVIQFRGVESLSMLQLREACHDRGMLGLLSVEEMQGKLKDWLNLSLNKLLPSSFLILAQSFRVPGRIKLDEALQATVSSLPDQVVDSVIAHAAEESLAKLQKKLDYLKEQELLMKEEEKKAKI